MVPMTEQLLAAALMKHCVPICGYEDCECGEDRYRFECGMGKTPEEAAREIIETLTTGKQE